MLNELLATATAAYMLTKNVTYFRSGNIKQNDSEHKLADINTMSGWMNVTKIAIQFDYQDYKYAYEHFRDRGLATQMVRR